MISQFETPVAPPVNVVKFGQNYVRVTGIKEAVQIWEKYRDLTGIGSSEAPNVTCCVDRKLYRISYNGRVWDPVTDLEVLY